MAQKEYLVKVTMQAELQLRELFYYIKEELKNPDAADRLMSIMEKAFLSLSKMPYRIALTEEEPWRSSGIHKMPVSNYYIYFWIDEENNKVQIMEVILARRDQRKQLLQIDSI